MNGRNRRRSARSSTPGIAAGIGVVFAAATVGYAQGGAQHALTKHTIDGGGLTLLTGGGSEEVPSESDGPEPCGGYDLSWHTIDGGGRMRVTGLTYELGGTAGQPDAAHYPEFMAGGGYELAGGFWVAARTCFPLYGDVNDDGFVNADDTLCLLDTFAGIPDSFACRHAPCEAKDIAPCPADGDPNGMGDGFVNTDDVLATLDVFAGIEPDPACAACTQP